MSEIQPQIRISISKEHAIFQNEIEEMFKALHPIVGADLIRLSAGELAMNVTVFLASAFVGGAAWDLLKLGIKSLFKKHPGVQFVIRDTNSIMYVIREDFSLNVIVIPERSKEFAHIKTFDDLVKFLDQK